MVIVVVNLVKSREGSNEDAGVVAPLSTVQVARAVLVEPVHDLPSLIIIQG